MVRKADASDAFRYFRINPDDNILCYTVGKFVDNCFLTFGWSGFLGRDVGSH